MPQPSYVSVRGKGRALEESLVTGPTLLDTQILEQQKAEGTLLLLLYCIIMLLTVSSLTCSQKDNLILEGGRNTALRAVTWLTIGHVRLMNKIKLGGRK